MRFEIQFIDHRSLRAGGRRAFAASRRLPVTLAWFATPSGARLILFVRPRATALLLAATVVAAYLGAGAGLASWFNRMPHNRIRTADLMLPWRWTKLQDLRGQMWCAQGVEMLRRGQAGQGISLIRRGLANHPNDPATRLALVEYFAKWRHYEGVRDTVMPQLAFPEVPRPLLELLFSEARRVDDATTVVECAQRLASPRSVSPACHKWLELCRAGALLRLQQPESALAVLADSELSRSGDAAELRIVALCALGRAEEAIALADQLPQAQVGEPQRRLRFLARAQSEAGRKTELAATLAESIAQNPDIIEPRIYAIEQFWAAHMPENAQRELDALLRRVSTQPGAIASIVSRLEESGAPALIKLCINETRALGQPVDRFLPILALSYVSVADWAGAEQTGETMLGTTRALSKAQMHSRRWLSAIVEAGALGTPRTISELKSALAAATFVLPSYVRAAQGFARAERWEAMQVIAEAGLKRFPRSAELGRHAREARQKLAAQTP